MSSLYGTVTTVRKIHVQRYCFTLIVDNSSKGLYKKSQRIVVDLRDSYYLATEELGCSNCGASF